MLKLLILLALSACTTAVKDKDAQQLLATQTNVFSIGKNLKLDCGRSLNCVSWKNWLEELVAKSSKHKIPKSFYQGSDQHYRPAKNFLQLLDQLGEVVVSYADYHCLDNQISCTFEGEKKIFFNMKALNLSKIDWLRVFWHEVFHLNYPTVPHVNCSSCTDHKSRVFSECDINSFSSYGLERFWLKTHAAKFSTDKSFNRHKKQALKDLSNRICRINSKI